MKKIIPAIIGGVVLGGGAVFGVSQIPSVNNALYKNVQSQQVSELENTNSKNEQTIKNLNLEIEDYKNQIVLKDESIASHLATIEELTAKNTQLLAIKEKLETIDIPSLTNENIALNQENADLKQELDTYKELVGSDVNYLDIINNLQKELESTTTSLTTANAELEQLRTDKLALETRVSELETELAQVKEELKGYKDSENIDKLNVANYKGTWYLDGTFEDYFNIDETGVAIHNANEDSGRVMNLYNQMYLFMNDEGSTAVTLADDGNSFTTADGQVYSRFYINTIETIVPNLIYTSGTYIYQDTSISLNSDNTLSYFDGTNTYHGAYVVTAQKKNVGGNISTIYYFNLTIQKEDDTIIKNFECVLGSSILVDIDESISYSLQQMNPVVLSGSESFTLDSVPATYLKLTIKTSKNLTIQPGEYLRFNLIVRLTLSGSNIVNVNGSSVYGNNYSYGIMEKSFDLYNYTDEDICSNTFDLYVYGYISLYGFSSVTFNTESIPFEVISVSGDGDFSSDYLKNHYPKETETFMITCDSVQDYTNGSYSNSNIDIALSEDTAIITPVGSDSINANSYNVSAYTDGTNIYQTVTITYTTTELVDEVETEVEHTLVLELENNSLLNSQLDSEDIELIKN